MEGGPTSDDLRAKVFEDRETPGAWRVEKLDEDGGHEVVKVFTGPRARLEAMKYAHNQFGEFDEVWLRPIGFGYSRIVSPTGSRH